jgi:hypothetical protein
MNKNLLPFITAAAGAGASYYFLGKEKKGDKRVTREGLEPWAVAAGGGLVGYIAGQFISSRLKPPPAPAVAAPEPKQVQEQPDQYVDLDGAPAGLPAPMSTEPDTRASGADDSDLMDSMGSFAGTGEGGLGSFANPYGDTDNLDGIDNDN